MKFLFCLLLLAYAFGVSYIYYNKIDISQFTNSYHDEKIEADTNHTKEIVKDKNISKKAVSKPKEKPIPKDAVVIKLPEVPKVEAKVPQVVTLGSKTYTHEDKQEKLSMEIPVIKKQEEKVSDTNSTKKTEVKLIGVEKLGRVSAYLRGKLLSKDKVIKKLKDGGFKVLSSKQLDNKGELLVITFTDDTLINLAKKSEFVAVLRVLIDKKNNQISITNPYYFLRAYLQESFDIESAKKLLKAINENFSDLKESKDKLKYTLLPKYQFMFGMPYYKDMIVVAKAKSSQELAQKIKKHSSFLLKISDDRYLAGVNLQGASGHFFVHTGEKNSLLLPYPVMIEGGIAKILDPKYYIALSYPSLKMSQFMKISEIPTAIENQCKEMFR